MSGKHQNTRRLTAVLDAIAAQAAQGVRQVDLVSSTGLGKATLHRMLEGLQDFDLVEFDPETNRYFIGPKVKSWSKAGAMRHSLVEGLRPVLTKTCNELGDTVYLTLKHGNRATYVERMIGSYPLKALPREVGEQRPLGIGAGPLAILAGLDSDALEATISEIKADLRNYGMREDTLRKLIDRSHALGFALHDGEIQEGMVAIGLPIRKGPSIVGAISVAATAKRLPEGKRAGVAAVIKTNIEDSDLDVECWLRPIGN